MNIKHFLTVLSVCVLPATLLAEVPVVSVTPDRNNMTPTRVYSNPITLTGTEDGQSWSLIGFSNNGCGWTTYPLRCFTNIQEQVVDAMITTDFAISAPIESVTLDIAITTTRRTDDNIVGMSLQMSGDPTFATIAAEYPFDYSDLPAYYGETGTIKVEIDMPVANMYYRIFLNKNQSTERGWLAILHISYWESTQLTDLPEIEADERTPEYYDLRGNRVDEWPHATILIERRGKSSRKVLMP